MSGKQSVDLEHNMYYQTQAFSFRAISGDYQAFPFWYSATAFKGLRLFADGSSQMAKLDA